MNIPVPIPAFRTYTKRIPPLFKFIIRGATLAVLYFVFYDMLRYKSYMHIPYEYLTHYLTNILLYLSYGALEIMGYDVAITGKVIRIADTPGVLLDRGCLGRNLLMLYAGFLFIYPGRWKPKLWYIPLGLFLIFLINTIRITGLAVISYEAPRYLGINHDYFFKYSVYALTFLMWWYYINKLSGPKGAKKHRRAK